MINSEYIGFIGAGNMGEALIGGIIEGEIAKADKIIIHDVSPDRVKHIVEKFGVVSSDSNPEIFIKCSKIFLAVKPQIVPSVLSELSSADTSKKLIVTICAGIKTKLIENSFKQPVRVVRVMPNTPSLIKCAASAVAGGKYASDEDMKWTDMVFSKIGIAVEVKEDLLDAVTGLSGSGPAYVFRLIEAMIEGGVEAGLPGDIAATLAKQTVYGAAKLALESPKTPTQLREAVTSPGGTTQAGLKVMNEAGFLEIIVEVIKKATERSKELGK